MGIYDQAEIEYLRELAGRIQRGEHAELNLRSLKSFLGAMVDWTFLNDCFKRGIRLQDLDGTVEAGGQFLTFEAKSGNADIPYGQRLYARRLVDSTRPECSQSFIFMWGKFGIWRMADIRQVRILTREGRWSEPFEASAEDVVEMTRQWFEAADSSLNKVLDNPLVEIGNRGTPWPETKEGMYGRLLQEKEGAA